MLCSATEPEILTATTGRWAVGHRRTVIFSAAGLAALCSLGFMHLHMIVESSQQWIPQHSRSLNELTTIRQVLRMSADCTCDTIRALILWHIFEISDVRCALCMCMCGMHVSHSISVRLIK
jgi:hypothetical protein